MINLPKPGDIVKAGSFGVVLDVFQSSHSGKAIVKILFVRNIIKGQPAEMHDVETFAEILPATRIDLEQEIQAQKAYQDKRFTKELFAAIEENAPTPIQLPVSQASQQ